MRPNQRALRFCLAIAFFLQPLAATRSHADRWVGRFKRLVGETTYSGTEPASCADGAIEHLAENIDWLEHYLDTYGSIVAKQPDIWGEARLTKHRDEYERVLFQELGGFAGTINAQISQADTAFFAQAFALGAAAGKAPDLPDLAEATKTTANTSQSTVALEPVIHLDQLSRYVHHLHELRRISEGDDTSDSPGYSLNLVRMPISIMPGKLTRRGFGAEVTVTAEPVITDDLMPTTFRNLVINDLVDQLGLPLVRTVERAGAINEALKAQGGYQIARTRLLDLLEYLVGSDSSGATCICNQSAGTDGAIGSSDDPCELERRIRAVVADGTARAVVLKSLRTLLMKKGHAVSDQTATSEISTTLDRSIDEILNRAIESSSDGILRFLDARPVGWGSSDMEPPDRTPTGTQRTFTSKENAGHSSPGEPSESSDGSDGVLLRPYGSPCVMNWRCTGNDAILNNLTQLYCALACYDEAIGKAERICKCPSIEATTMVSPDEPRGCGRFTVEEPRAVQVARDALACIVDLVRSSQTISLRGDRTKGMVPGGPRCWDPGPRAPAITDPRPSGEAESPLREYFDELIEKVDREINDLNRTLVAVVPTGRARRATNSLNPSLAVDVFGFDNVRLLATTFSNAYYGRYIRWAGHNTCKDARGKSQECRVDLLDAQRWLRAEAAAAHEFFTEPRHASVLAQLASTDSGLARAIRSARRDGASGDAGHPCETIVACRNYFFDSIQERSGSKSRGHACGCNSRAAGERESRVARNPAEALAWAYVVESALLNQRLNDDIRKLASAKQEAHLDTNRDYNFAIPDSVLRPNTIEVAHLRNEFQAATEIFQRYVATRWPIHVFAIDPREQDQNVADASARRRELQFAMSLAFVTGQIGANSLTQFARTLETQVQTIGLNRTIAGFAHGHDTFGWRIQPRVQGLEAPGTLGALKQTICGINPDADLVDRKIEPGVREAVAIVLMPSFVPYVDFDIRTNWYKLNNPKNTAFTMRDTMRLSRAVTAMRRSRAVCSKCQHHYREGELRRLLKRVDQLDRELPLQTLTAQAPYENTLGGFEMFNTGVTDLAPELIGWYGAPGIAVGEDYECGCFDKCQSGGRHRLSSGSDGTNPLPTCEGKGTTVFLVGDNFSVHDTKVIAGGVCIPHVQLVSREIMRVTIPSCVNHVEVDGKDYVAVYAATPYGVTNHLHVPVQRRKPSKQTIDAIKAAVAAAIPDAAKKAAEMLGVEDMKVAASDKLVFDAKCDDRDPRKLDVTLRSTPARVVFDTRYHGPAAAGCVRSSGDVGGTLYVAAYNKRFRTPLVELGNVVVSGGVGRIMAPHGTLDTRLSRPIANGVSYDEFGAAKKLDLKGYFYFKPERCDCEFAERVGGEMDIEVRLACDCCERAAVAMASAGPRANGAGDAETITTPTPQPEGGKPGAGDNGDCDCEKAAASDSGSSDQENGAPSVRFAHVITEGGLKSEVSIRRFNVPFVTADQLGAGDAAGDAQPEAAAQPSSTTVETPQAASGSGVIVVNPPPMPTIIVNQNAPQTLGRESILERIGGSAANEFSTNVRENWRNFRDCVTGSTP